MHSPSPNAQSLLNLLGNNSLMSTTVPQPKGKACFALGQMAQGSGMTTTVQDTRQEAGVP